MHLFNDPLIALQEFKPDLYHLVIIDILMPKMNGFELYDKLRELDSKIKICFLTAGSEIYYEEVIKEAFRELDTNCIRYICYREWEYAQTMMLCRVDRQHNCRSLNSFGSHVESPAAFLYHDVLYRK